MRIAKLTIAVAAIWTVASPAYAAEDVLFGPAPDWVVETGPAPAEAQGTDAGQLPIRVISNEHQMRLEPGRQVAYFSFAMRIQTPQGLSAGDLSLAWQPEFDELTIHKVHIRRGDEIIDVLEEGQTFTTLRREQSLEQATLTGVLTANMFPAGLEVGDTLEVAYSIASSNPVMAGHAEAVLGPFNIPAAEIDVVLQWPEDLPVRLATTRGLPEWDRRSENGYMLAALSLDDVEPITPPTGAPPRYSLLRLVEASDFASWQEVADLFVPLYAEASRIAAEGPLREKVEEIRAETTDPARRAELALQLVQDDVRYVALAMGEGGLVPADTATTWQRRYGDCKAKTALLLGILAELGIEAEAVAVNTVIGDALPERLPMVGVFDHILVRAHIGGQQYWMDGTRSGDTSLARLRVPNFHWGLPVVAQGAELVPMVPAVMTIPEEDIAIHMDGSEGMYAPVPTEISITLRGDTAIGTNAVMSQMVGEAREQALEQYWRGRYDFIDPEELDVTFDGESGELVMSMSGMAELEWDNGFYETDDTRVGYNADFTRVDGPEKSAPFFVPHPFFDRTVQTIILPEEYDDAAVYGGEYDETVGGIEYRRQASVEGNVFTVTRTARSVAAEIPFAEVQTAEDRLTALWDDRLYLDLPDNYRLTETDVAAMSTRETNDADDLIDQGHALLNAGEYDAALAAFDRASEIDPGDVWSWANKAVAHAWLGQLDEAEQAAARAQEIDPENYVMWHARGMAAQRRSDPRTAEAAFSRALSANPRSTFALEHRATSRIYLGDHDGGLEDASRLVELSPQYTTGYMLKAFAHYELGRADLAEVTVEAMLAALPDNPDAQVAASEAYLNMGLDERAESAMEASLGGEPTAFALTARANRRSIGETDQKLAELTQALEINPEHVPALVSRANTLWMEYEYDDAMADADRAIEIAPAFLPAYDVKSKILVDQERETEAAELADAVVDANPELPDAYMFAANLHRRLGNAERADELIERQLALGAGGSMQVNALLARASQRSIDDHDGRESDVREALSIEPDNVRALYFRASLEREQGNFGSAVSTLNRLRELQGDEPGLLNQLAMALLQAGRADQAEATFDEARALAHNANDLNTLCWGKAVASIALERALEECNASLDLTEHAATLDSRAMVYLRMGRLDEARADFDQAIEKSPALANSLFGRAIVRARQGDEEGAQRDAREARRHWPEVDRAFAQDYKMAIPALIASAEGAAPEAR